MTYGPQGNVTGERSGFVTALAWSFIVLAALSVAWGLLQFAVIQVFVDQEALRAGMRTQHSMENLPATVRFAFSNIKLLAGLFLAFSGILLWISIGLLQRRNWARLVFIAFMGLAALGHVVPLFGGSELLAWSADLLAGAPESARQRMQGVIQAAWLAFAVLSVLLAAVFAWIGWKLTRPEIRVEFQR